MSNSPAAPVATSTSAARLTRSSRQRKPVATKAERKKTQDVQKQSETARPAISIKAPGPATKAETEGALRKGKAGNKPTRRE